MRSILQMVATIFRFVLSIDLQGPVCSGPTQLSRLFTLLHPLYSPPRVVQSCLGPMRQGHLQCSRDRRNGSCQPVAYHGSCIAAWRSGMADGCQGAKSARCCLPIGPPCKGSNQQATLAGFIKPSLSILPRNLFLLLYDCPL